jgi:hypothetical protein
VRYGLATINFSGKLLTNPVGAVGFWGQEMNQEYLNAQKVCVNLLDNDLESLMISISKLASTKLEENIKIDPHEPDEVISLETSHNDEKLKEYVISQS